MNILILFLLIFYFCFLVAKNIITVMENTRYGFIGIKNLKKIFKKNIVDIDILNSATYFGDDYWGLLMGPITFAYFLIKKVLTKEIPPWRKK
jgi:hypothetical protein